jgi:5'-nucleotidase
VTWDGRRPRGDRITALALDDGRPIDRAGRYRITVNSFLAGGDGFTVLAAGAEREVGPVDLDALVEYVEQLLQPFSARTEGRISRSD